jgi:hypothetical protein
LIFPLFLCDKLARAERERAELETAIRGIIEQVLLNVEEATAARTAAREGEERRRVEEEPMRKEEEQRKVAMESRHSVAILPFIAPLHASCQETTAQPSADASQPLTPPSLQAAAASSAVTAAASENGPINDDFVPSMEELLPQDPAFVPEGLLFKFERAAVEKKKWHAPSLKTFKVLGIVGEMHGVARASWDVPSCMIQWDKRPAYPVLQCTEGPSPQLQTVRKSPSRSGFCVIFYLIGIRYWRRLTRSCRTAATACST